MLRFGGRAQVQYWLHEVEGTDGVSRFRCSCRQWDTEVYYSRQRSKPPVKRFFGIQVIMETKKMGDMIQEMVRMT